MEAFDGLFSYEWLAGPDYQGASFADCLHYDGCILLRDFGSLHRGDKFDFIVWRYRDETITFVPIDKEAKWIDYPIRIKLEIA
jgi:hypothetical protein